MKLDLRENMYIRTNCGRIDKIFNIKDDYVKGVSQKDELYAYDIDNIVKASYNITDLIEVGDIITFNFSNDVYKVLCVPNKKVGCEDFYFEYDISQEFEDLRMKPEMVKGQIKSIITKEQMEQIEYKVGE